MSTVARHLHTHSGTVTVVPVGIGYVMSGSVTSTAGRRREKTLPPPARG
jgi:hypothetical protein